MKAWIVSQLRRLLLRLDPPPVEVPVPLDPLDIAADSLTHQADQLADSPSGEYKRHWVYGKLIKQFPDRRRRDIALAIELALQTRP